MENKGYYTRTIEEGNCARTDTDLFVNCTGHTVLASDFTGGHPEGRNDYYLIYLCKGALHIPMPEGELLLKSGQAIIFSPNTPSPYYTTPGTCLDYYWVHFTGAKADALLERVRLPQNTPVSVAVDERIISAFNRLFDEYVERDFLFDSAILLWLLEICTLLGRSAAALAERHSAQSLSTALRYIDENYAKPITTQALAEMEHMSCGYFRAVFKKKTGMTPTEYILTHRLRNACLLLRQTDLSVKEIAQSVGFTDQMYFSRVFAHRLGLPPKRFRA